MEQCYSRSIRKKRQTWKSSIHCAKTTKVRQVIIVNVYKKSRKEKLFTLSSNIRLSLWIITIIYLFLVNRLNFPGIISAYLVFTIGFFVLMSDLYFKKTLGTFGIIVTKKTALVWSILHFIFCVVIGFVLLKTYS